MTRAAQLLAGAAIAALFISSARAAEWTDTDRALMATALALHVADWSQTLRIVGDDRFKEYNPILGAHPTRRQVNSYFLATSALMLGGAHLLPEYRRILLYGYIAVGAVVVGHNLGIGLRIGF